MKAVRTRSLRKRLIVRLVVVQALALVLTGLLGLLGIGWLTGLDGRAPDARDMDIVMEALVASGEELSLAPTRDLQALVTVAPDIWFGVEDEAGRRLTYGPIPPEFQPLVENLGQLAFSSIRDFGTEDRFGAHVRVFHSNGTRIHMILGNGNTLDIFSAALRAANRLLLFIFAILAITTIFAIPIIVRRELSGVEAIARAAETIDFDQQGKTLQPDNLPTEIEPVVRAFNSALKRLDEGYTRQKRFLSAAAHELKTPIAILQTRIETSATGPERTQFLLDVARLTTLAEQLLDTQRLEHRGKDFLPADLVELTRQVTGDLAPLAIAHGYTIEFDSKVSRYMVTIDSQAIERALTNLIHNAIAHGGGKGHIRIAINAHGVVEIQDDGDGISRDDRDKIFEPFVRLEPNSGGAGLGLSLVADIIRWHAGKISVTKSASGGAIFRLSLPSERRQPKSAD